MKMKILLGLSLLFALSVRAQSDNDKVRWIQVKDNHETLLFVLDYRMSDSTLFGTIWKNAFEGNKVFL